jgi:hypothetical protein
MMGEKNQIQDKTKKLKKKKKSDFALDTKNTFSLNPMIRAPFQVRS